MKRIIQIIKMYNEEKEIDKLCRLVICEDLKSIHESIINDRREIYQDNYLIGNLRHIPPASIFVDIKDNELLYIMNLWNGNVMINKFIELEEYELK